MKHNRGSPYTKSTCPQLQQCILVTFDITQVLISQLHLSSQSPSQRIAHTDNLRTICHHPYVYVCQSKTHSLFSSEFRLGERHWTLQGNTSKETPKYQQEKGLTQYLN